MSLVDYTESLVDPFSTALLQPKILDGKVSRSSGIRLRSTGEIVCDPAAVTYIALIPGLANVITWKTSPSTDTTPSAFGGHISVDSDRANIKHVRTVGAALTLNLVNAADQNEGYWEAARIPTSKSDMEMLVGTEGLVNMATFFATGIELANHQTYQTGKLRDLHRYQFKLNSVTNEHPFGSVTNTPTVSDYVSDDWDTVIIKIHGRVESGAPSVLMYDAISNQEVIYKENTALARLMSHSPYIPATRELLDKTKYELPAVQVE